jgi:acylphosphatase
MARARIHLLVEGIVQGVFFRQSTLHEAQRLGLVGWVANRADGAVELEAEGEEAALGELVAWAQHGPPAAKVERVSQRSLAPTNAERGFVVRR